MKKHIITLFTVFLSILFVSACGNAAEENKADSNDSGNREANDNNNANEAANVNNHNEDSLADYSDEDIEYARIWLQLGDTQDIEELNVHQIASGTPLNPDDESSLDYPEDVVQLRGESVAQGSITYSSNGDGTITVYHKVPARWDGDNPAGEEVYEKILDDTETVSVDAGENEDVEHLIQKINTEDNSAPTEESEELADYSSDEIEYARVWLEVIGNKDIDHLHVSHQPEGEQVNQYDDDSVDYPEDVIFLSGDAMADGVVTYSGNGDGTIDLYDVPSHWPAAEQLDETMKEYTQDIVDHPETKEVDTRDDDEVKEVVEKVTIED